MKRKVRVGNNPVIQNNYRAWALIVALGGFLFGFDATVISGAIGFVTREFGLSAWQIGLVVAAPTLLGIPASITVSTLADRFGRKPVLILLAVLYTLSALCAAYSTSFWMLVAARAVGGYAFGSLGLAPIYISEVAPAEGRGRLVSFNQLNIVIGFSAAYFGNYLILSLSQSGAPWVADLGLDVHAWRYMLGIQVVPAVLWLVMLFKIPESPRWLVLRGRIDEARAVFNRYLPRAESDRLVTEVGKQEPMRPLLKRVAALGLGKYRFVLIVGITLAIAQQITGINAVYFYAPSIFEQSGVGTNAAFAQAIMIGVVNIVFTLFAMALIDRVGRRPLLIVGTICITLSMAVLAYGFSQARYELVPAYATELAQKTGSPGVKALIGRTFDSDVAFKNALGETLTPAQMSEHEATILQRSTTLNPTLILIAILGFVASFAFSLGPVMWVMLPEIYPNAIRGVAMAAVGAINSVVSFAVQMSFPIQVANFGSAGTFATYAAAGVVFTILILWLVPETKGKSLEELESELTGPGAVA